MVCKEVVRCCRRIGEESLTKPRKSWQLFSAHCFQGSTTCSAVFSKRDQKQRHINVSVGHQTEDALKAETIRRLAATPAQNERRPVPSRAAIRRTVTAHSPGPIPSAFIFLYKLL